MKKLSFAVGIAALFSFLFSTLPAFADSNIEAYPTAWRLQDYEDNTISIFFTGSPCTNGRLILPASVSADSKNRFWSTILSAKMANKIVGIFYNPTTCEITSFYLKEG